MKQSPTMASHSGIDKRGPEAVSNASPQERNSLNFEEDQTMASLPIWTQTPASHRLFILGVVVVMAGGANNFQVIQPAQACGIAGSSQTDSSPTYQSPVNLSDLTAEEQQALAETVAERREILPYRFLSLYRCPSLSNDALSAFENQHYAQALALLDSAIAENPASLTRWLDRAVVHYYLGEDAAARADAKQVRRLNETHSRQVREAYRQLMFQLDGKFPDPRRAVER